MDRVERDEASLTFEIGRSLYMIFCGFTIPINAIYLCISLK